MKKPPMTENQAKEVVAELKAARKGRPHTIPKSLRFYLENGNLSDAARAVYAAAISELSN